MGKIARIRRGKLFFRYWNRLKILSFSPFLSITYLIRISCHIWVDFHKKPCNNKNTLLILHPAASMEPPSVPHLHQDGHIKSMPTRYKPENDIRLLKQYKELQKRLDLTPYGYHATLRRDIYLLINSICSEYVGRVIARSIPRLGKDHTSLRDYSKLFGFSPETIRGFLNKYTSDTHKGGENI